MSAPTSDAPPTIATVGIFIWPDMTMLDVLGPHQALGITPGIEVFTFARTKDPLVTDSGLTIIPDHDFSDIPACDVLLVGGGGNPYPEMTDPEVIETLARVGAQADYVTSVCTGALFLAEAGLLEGYRANTHWTAREILGSYPGVEVADGRVVVDRNRITGGGVTAGIDFALSLIAILIDEATASFVQLIMEYNPAPPFTTGHPDTSPPELVTAARGMCEQAAPEMFANARVRNL
ncbi:MAG TPA: DJ-1/PfpI family protein [Pseudonocardia sp.]|jgi:transcriptional regulator GlxA family with amidase domain|nr:DJ-1/PfpI family protein [Pseudonocardia sp.]